MNSRNIFFSTRFLVSVFSLKDLPTDIGLEIAFCGRSNSGKSSVLNAITRNKKLAKTSKTPGRTRAINIFSIDDHNEVGGLGDNLLCELNRNDLLKDKSFYKIGVNNFPECGSSDEVLKYHKLDFKSLSQKIITKIIL